VALPYCSSGGLASHDQFFILPGWRWESATVNSCGRRFSLVTQNLAGHRLLDRQDIKMLSRSCSLGKRLVSRPLLI